MNELLLSSPNEARNAARARTFCDEFRHPGARRYVLGRNVYARALVERFPIEGVIDDYTADREWLSRPVVRSGQVPADAMVVVAAGGMPLTAMARIEALGLRGLDYFAFRRHAGEQLPEIVFNAGWVDDYREHPAEYRWIHDRLADPESRQILRKLLSFRVKGEIEFLSGFTNRESSQYFESFLHLATDGESFLDVGGYRGESSLQFMTYCPRYRSIDVFEPDPENRRACAEALAGRPNVAIHPFGASDRAGRLRIASCGSQSRIAEDGDVEIEVRRLDELAPDSPTYLKIDIEGGEHPALDGARGLIAAHRPRLAIAVYHGAGDFWRIPRRVLSIRDDYDIVLRHYTESIYETVMYFVPHGARADTGHA